MQTNRQRLVAQNVCGQAAPPLLPSSLYDVGHDGVPRIVPSVGGITLNVRVGDSAFAYEADHIEPGVSMRHADESVNRGLCTFACIGNVATVTSGEAKGERGVVTGKHGGVEHVLVDFAPEVKERMQIGDAIAIRAVGVGLELADAGDVKVFNCDPDLLEKLGVERRDDRWRVPVARIVPARVMGSGLGRQTVARGDYDIQCFDAQTVREFGLDQLRLGDVVAIVDADNSFGRIYRTGAVTIATVSHGSSFIAGHGPGVTTLLTSASGAIEPYVDARANLAVILGLRAV
ncbi:MAG TPA: DUF4438 domain-containing protein [Candidatus Limnocylindria bacterium]|jgi:hypothetical protein|nr:DUF4438 domain-containing protein [Candidatus Limnocylindria bacterium]